MKNKNCTLSDRQLTVRCEKWIKDLCQSGGRKWSLNVPPDDNNDPDLLFSELIERFRCELEATQTLKEKISNLNPNMCDDGYSDGYYTAIRAVEKILNGGE